MTTLLMLAVGAFILIHPLLAGAMLAQAARERRWFPALLALGLLLMFFAHEGPEVSVFMKNLVVSRLGPCP